MKIVVFSQVPRWYSFRADRLLIRLQEDGHDVLAVVVKRTSTLKFVREWAFKLGTDLFIKKSVNKLLRLFKVSIGADLKNNGRITFVMPPIYVMDSHNSSECVEFVRSLKPDIILLRGCGIIKREILQIPKIATLNPHYAILPEYRGMDVTEWAVLHGDPVAVSVHYVNEGVDTGEVVASRVIPIERAESLGGLREKSAVVAVDLFIEALHKITDHKGATKAKTVVGGLQYFEMHPRLRRLANDRLSKMNV